MHTDLDTFLTETYVLIDDFLPQQSGFNERMRRLAPSIERVINYLAFVSPGFCDGLRLLDSIPVPFSLLACFNSRCRWRRIWSLLRRVCRR